MSRPREAPGSALVVVPVPVPVRLVRRYPLLLVASDGSWSLAAVWHAMLNAAGASFFFTMVSGHDKARLDLLLAGVYSVVAMTVYVAGRRHHSIPSSLTGADSRRPHTGGTHVDRHASTHL